MEIKSIKVGFRKTFKLCETLSTTESSVFGPLLPSAKKNLSGAVNPICV